MTEKTKGERIVRTDFNASRDSTVDSLKCDAAALIDEVDQLPVVKSPEGSAEQARLKALAITHLEIAAMFAVKAATVSPQ